jgi:hypothetical protein
MGKTLFAKCEIATLVRGHLNCAGLARLLFYSPIRWTERILSALVIHHMPHLLSLTERLANCRAATSSNNTNLFSGFGWVPFTAHESSIGLHTCFIGEHSPSEDFAAGLLVKMQVPMCPLLLHCEVGLRKTATVEIWMRVSCHADTPAERFNS